MDINAHISRLKFKISIYIKRTIYIIYPPGHQNKIAYNTSIWTHSVYMTPEYKISMHESIKYTVRALIIVLSMEPKSCIVDVLPRKY
jgi:hypothetical protein